MEREFTFETAERDDATVVRALPRDGDDEGAVVLEADWTATDGTVGEWERIIAALLDFGGANDFAVPYALAPETAVERIRAADVFDADSDTDSDGDAGAERRARALLELLVAEGVFRVEAGEVVVLDSLEGDPTAAALLNWAGALAEATDRVDRVIARVADAVERVRAEADSDSGVAVRDLGERIEDLEALRAVLTEKEQELRAGAAKASIAPTAPETDGLADLLGGLASALAERE